MCLFLNASYKKTMNMQLMRVTPESVGIPSRTVLHFIDELEDTTLTDIHSIMIARYNKICAEGWWNPYAPGLAHAAWSHSKTYTAAGVGIAVHQGLLRLDECIVDIFPELVSDAIDPKMAAVTIRNLLCMSSGVADEVFGCNEDWLEVFLHSKIAYEPGNGFSYVSQGTNALGQIVARRAGISFAQYLEENLFKKIGIHKENTSWMRVPDGSELAAGGLHCTTEDNLRLMLLFLNDGCWNGERILDSDFVREATSEQVPTEPRYDHMPSASSSSVERKQGYGFQIWMHSYPNAYAAQGAQGQYTFVFPDQQLVVSMTQIINPDYPDSDKLYKLAESIAIAAVPNSLPKEPDTYERLKRRLGRLCIPAPCYCSYMPMADKIEQHIYQTNKNRFTIYPMFEAREHRDTGRLVTRGIDRFSFSFSPNRRSCVLDFEEDGINRSLTIALDGTRTHNLLYNPNQLAKEVLLNGYWESEQTLVIQARWLETTVEKTLWFTFEKDKVHIKTDLTLGSMGAFRKPPETAEAEKNQPFGK